MGNYRSFHLTSLIVRQDVPARETYRRFARVSSVFVVLGFQCDHRLGRLHGAQLTRIDRQQRTARSNRSEAAATRARLVSHPRPPRSMSTESIQSDVHECLRRPAAFHNAEVHRRAGAGRGAQADQVVDGRSTAATVDLGSAEQ